ncbi:MAG: thiamine-phosphate kinase [Thermoplasmata archaeon]|nr:thiamine-phosphate kinase [Thermoplasmata archaeon]
MTPRGRRRPPAAFSERMFHAWLTADARSTAAVPLPIGDDAAAIRLRPGTVALLTTDALVEGIHFLRASPPRSVGRAAAAVSLSDVASKGGRPIGLLLDLLLPPETEPQWAREVVTGARREIRRWGGELVGGDTKPSGSRTVVGTILAEADPRRLAPRTAARPGDALLLTGTAGRGGAAASRLARGPPTASALRRLLAVEPRVAEGRALIEFAHAMLDTSDGVAESARLLSQASRARVEVDRDRLPADPALARIRPESRREAALFYGGDYELLAAVPPARVGAAMRAVARVGGTATVVGRVRAGRGAFLQRGRKVVPMPPAGWDPFVWARDRV